MTHTAYILEAPSVHAHTPYTQQKFQCMVRLTLTYGWVIIMASQSKEHEMRRYLTNIS